MDTKEEIVRPVCCNKKMMKAGWQWSGRHKVQRYRCGNCGRVTTAPSKNKKGID